jgi:hypothetical protein
MHTLPGVILLVGALVGADVTHLTAQSAGRPPSLAGIVTAAHDGSPLAGAVVRELTTGQEVRTDANGRFRLSALPAGPQTVEVRYPGFEPVVLDVTLQGDELFTIPTGVLSLLEEVTGFQRRRAKGRGEFVDREQLDGRHARQLSDVLRQVAGVRVESRVGEGPGAGRFRIRMIRAPENCHPIAFLDGAFLGSTALFDVDGVISVDALHQLEVYRGLGEVPAEFALPGAQCGVLVMWTEE